jgi:hypothetical protein
LNGAIWFGIIGGTMKEEKAVWGDKPVDVSAETG